MRVETDALKALANKKAASADLLLCKTPGKKRASGKALFPKGVFFLRGFAQFCAALRSSLSYRYSCALAQLPSLLPLFACACAVLRSFALAQFCALSGSHRAVTYSNRLDFIINKKGRAAISSALSAYLTPMILPVIPTALSLLAFAVFIYLLKISR